ncbi:MAG: elongation factor Ts [Chloroflexota bacterium]|nr:MAG: elongation factor Ts [Chloroflexota bacterium]
MEISLDKIKAVREQAGAGVMDAKKALEDSGGDIEKALDTLRDKGMASAIKKGGRETGEGLIETYVHGGGKVGVMLEVNCETDFVARTDDFKELCHNLAMQIAAMSPIYINADEIPDDEKRSPEELALTSQAYIRDPAVSVSDLILEAAGKLGENVKIKRFSRFALGE